MLGGLRDFIETQHDRDDSFAVPPIVEETPPFMRALTTASMDTPGPFEKVAKEAFFNVTLPEKTWTRSRPRSICRASIAGTIISTAVHEVYPGPLHAVPLDRARADARSASCWAAGRTPKAGRTTPSR